jgi:hypothetical protein
MCRDGDEPETTSDERVLSEHAKIIKFQIKRASERDKAADTYMKIPTTLLSSHHVEQQ